MMNSLRINQTHRNMKEGNFPKKRKLSPDTIDKIIEKEERRIMKRRILCKGCMTYKSTSGCCFC